MAEPSQNAALRAALPWILAAVIVLAFAVTAGFVTAYLVATGRTAEAPPVGAASPGTGGTPAASVAPGTSPEASGEATPQPRRTPTPPPVVTPEPTPFTHVIARNESLSYIAGLYCTTVDAIVELNGIENPNRVREGQRVLIPGGGCPPETAEPTRRR